MCEWDNRTGVDLEIDSPSDRIETTIRNWRIGHSLIDVARPISVGIVPTSRFPEIESVSGGTRRHR